MLEELDELFEVLVARGCHARSSLRLSMRGARG